MALENVPSSGMSRGPTSQSQLVGKRIAPVLVWPFDVKVHPMEPRDVVQWLELNKGRKALLANHNMHSLFLFESDSQFRATYEKADITLIDGFPIWAMARFRSVCTRGDVFARDARCGSTDWLLCPDFLSLDIRLAVIGAASVSNENAVKRLREIMPRARISGWNGYHDLNNLQKNRFAELVDFKPDIVVVGLGMPVQEAFLHENWKKLPTAIYATVGGAIDQISGEQRLAPRWVGRVGLEWLWRLVSSPRRLWFRYMVEPALLVGHLIRRRRVAGRGTDTPR